MKRITVMVPELADVRRFVGSLPPAVAVSLGAMAVFCVTQDDHWLQLGDRLLPIMQRTGPGGTEQKEAVHDA